MQSSKLPRGRHLIGDRVVYDINVRLQGEEQPQLVVTPITKYRSDPQLVLGRRIAVNGKYICYVLTMGSIRVLNIKTALRVLLKGDTQVSPCGYIQRVSDIAFFAEDVHLLASATVDGRFYVWKISEGPDDEDRQQIIGSVVIAVQIVGEEGVTHPRVCWHSRKQEILIIGIGKHVLRIDTTKVGKSETYSAEGPIICSIDKLIDGIQYVGNHDGEVTDLSSSQWMTTRLVSASTDGTIKIWEDRKAQPLLVLRPHNGDPVSSALFLTAPERPDHIVLVTAGPLNRQVKCWASTNEEGWLSSDAESWHCTQTLDLQDSGESRADEAFFNQIVLLSQAGILICSNAKKNAIYAVHIDYGSNAAATRMDYITEFTVTMPILSFTGTSGLSYYGAHNIVAVYCVQTQAIQQYALHLAQCLPPPLDKTGIENSDSIVSLEAANGFEQDSTLGDHGCKQPVIEYTVDRQVCNSGTNVSDTLSAADDSRNDDKNVSRDDMTGAQNHINVCKLVTHLITSEILRADSSSDTTNVTGSNPCSQTFPKLPTHLITPSELPRETEESVQPEFRHLLSLIVEPILQEIKESVQSDFRHQLSLRVQPILQEIMESALSDFNHQVSLRVQSVLQEIEESMQSVVHHQVSLAVQPMLQVLDAAFAQYDAELQQRLAESSARPDSFA